MLWSLRTFWLLHASTLRVASQEYVSASDSQTFQLPAFTYRQDTSADTDLDGLRDLAEFIIATDPTNPDTDGDGFRDGAEVSQGQNPVDGRLAATGIVASADTPGTALDVCVQGDRALVADGPAGLAIFNVFNPLNPLLIGQVDTPGSAVAVACSDERVAVADGLSGLAVVDVSDPANARVMHQTSLGADATAVAASDGLAYVALGSAGLAVVDMATGIEIHREIHLGDVDDVKVERGLLFILTSTHLLCRRDYFGGLASLGSLQIPGDAAPLESGRKMSLCGNRAFVGTFSGWYHVDVSRPESPQVLGAPSGLQAAVHDLVHDGKDQVIAITSFSGARSLAVSLYDASVPSDTTRLVTSHDTPGVCRAIAFHAGLAFVTDTLEGLQVLNLRPFDPGVGAPTVVFDSIFPDESASPGIQISEGRTFLLNAAVQSEGLVREVSLLLDGQEVASAAACPWEFRVTLPLLSDGREEVALQLRAVDMGGNVAFSTPVAVRLLPSDGAPLLISTFPQPGVEAYDRVTPSLTFDEPLDVSRLGGNSVTLIHLGNDGVLGGGDDVPEPLRPVTLGAGGRLLTLVSEQPLLRFGAWLLRVAPGAVADPSGNVLATGIDLPFTVSPRPPTIRWISDVDGSWHNPANWDPPRVPSAGDQVLVMRQNSDPVVVITNRVLVQSLDAWEALQFRNATLIFTNGHRSEVRTVVSATNTTFTFTGPAAWVSMAGFSNALDCSFVSEGGSSGVFPDLLAYNGLGISDKTFAARGLGSRLDLPRLRDLLAPLARTVFFFSPVLRVQAIDGGWVSLPVVGPDLEGRVDVESFGVGSRVSLPEVVSMAGAPATFHGIETRDGGIVEVGKLASAERMNLIVGGPDTLVLNLLTQAVSATILSTNGSWVLPSLLHLDSSSVLARSNAVIRLPALVRQTSSGSEMTWSADGAGARIEFPSLSEAEGPLRVAGLPRLRIESLRGGRMDFPALTVLTNGRWTIKVEGQGSEVLMPAVARLAGHDAASRSLVDVQAKGVLTLPLLERVERVDLLLDSDAGYSTRNLTHLLHGQLEARGFSPILSRVVDATGNGFLAQGGAVIALPGVTSLNVSVPKLWRADGAGSRLDFGNLIDVTGPTTAGGLPKLEIHAINGGVVDCGGVVSIRTGRFAFFADNPGSRVSFTGLTNFHATTFPTVSSARSGTVQLSMAGGNVRGADPSDHRRWNPGVRPSGARSRCTAFGCRDRPFLGRERRRGPAWHIAGLALH
ncbi:MAG: hypothetical protein FJ405_07175 [Verrucomicrobia bacterium]|nr:hypothetical protein [Verrucomicrobiota bacterium]